MSAAQRRDGRPTPAVLGLSSPHAAEDLAFLGWDDDAHADVAWALAGCADPDGALNSLVRLVHALQEDTTPLSDAAPTPAAAPPAGSATPQANAHSEFLAALAEDEGLRVRLFALLGGSTALADHLVAHPHLWETLRAGLPTGAEMRAALLDSVHATRIDTADTAYTADTEGAKGAEGTEGTDDRVGPEADVAATAGMYRAEETGREAVSALSLTYRSLIMRIAAWDLAGTYPTTKRHRGLDPVPFETVTGLLSELADAALTAALAVAVRTVYGDRQPDARLAIIAMGKCGARELNYISDIDVIFVAEPASAKATRLAGECARIGSEAFFEVDANLRPEGRSGALVRTVDSHVAYYKRWAQTWEFQALLKARFMVGDGQLAQAYLEQLEPMVWTAGERESFVEDVQAMRSRVLDTVPEDVRDRELKLGRGGLRDVEFAVQLLQLVHGRADESLRVAGTVDALAALVNAGIVGREDGRGLIEAYEFLRLLEHRQQLHRMRRTHLLPAAQDDAAMARLAAAAGFAAGEGRGGVDKLKDAVRKARRLISQLHSRLFYRPLLRSVVSMSVDTLRLSPQAAKLQLAALGYKFPDRAFEHLAALAAGSSRKSKIQAMLLPTLMEWLSATADPDAGLLNYRKLSEAAYDRSWFLRLLRDEEVVGQRLMSILGTSPYTAELIIATPDFVKLLGDGATGPKLLDVAPDTVSRSLVTAAGRHHDPDKAISVARSLRRKELARIASADLLGLMDVPAVCHGLSTVWNAVLDAALNAEIRASLAAAQPGGPGPEAADSADADGDGASDSSGASGAADGADGADGTDGADPAAEQRPRAGHAPARIAVIGMGRLGGAELGYGSDADVMFVARPEPGVSEDDAVKWAIGVCDSMRTRLAKPSGDPPLDVDLGLRPEGRSGPVVRTVESYDAYYRRWGEVWEAQALLRAEVIAGDRGVGEEFLAAIEPLRYPEGGASAATIREVRRMKARVDSERLPRGADRTTHTKLGRGALTDVEWTVQLLQMQHSHTHAQLHTPSTLEALAAIGEAGLLPDHDVEVLRHAWLTATRARNALVLVRGRRTDQLPQPGPQLAQVAAAAGWAPDQYQEFLEDYLRSTRRARKVIDEVFWGERTGEL
ncbi:bifunctional [glutamine synthetase] adenylyltransferase/[glutamine synthetase]-adenylyl-L-tyrosine phosphorylase [Corynebacterium uberis]